jgi:hypothetical protein
MYMGQSPWARSASEVLAFWNRKVYHRANVIDIYMYFYWSILLRRICRLKKDEVSVGWRKLYYEEVHNLLSHSHRIKKNELDEACSMCGGDEKCVYNFRWNAWREETTQKV